MNPRKQIVWLCARGRSGIAEPFRWSLDGDDWDAATNGHVLLMIRGATWPPVDSAPDLDKSVLSVIEGCGNPVAVTGLLEWAFGGIEPCESCDGTRWIDDFDACSCDDGLPSTQHGSVGGVLFNRRLLYRALILANAYVPAMAHEVMWRDATSPIFVRDADGDGPHRTLIAVMPMRDYDIADMVIEPLEDIAK